MKFLLFALSFVFSTSVFAVTIDDVVGVFDVSSTDIPIKGVFHIKKAGPDTATFKLDIKRSPYGKLACRAKGVLDDGIMKTDTVCKSGLRYQHTIHYNPVTDFDKFNVNVHNTLYGETINMRFIRKR